MSESGRAWDALGAPGRDAPARRWQLGKAGRLADAVRAPDTHGKLAVELSRGALAALLAWALAEDAT